MNSLYIIIAVCVCLFIAYVVFLKKSSGKIDQLQEENKKKSKQAEKEIEDAENQEKKARNGVVDNSSIADHVRARNSRGRVWNR